MGRRAIAWRVAPAAIGLAAGGLVLAALAPAASAAPHRATVLSASTVSSASRTATPAFIAKPKAAAVLPAGQRLACGLPKRPGQMACQAVIESDLPAASSSGYGPSSLQSAYGLTSASARRGGGETVAIVDAYSDPDLASNLASYRSHFGLPACGTRSGCLRIVNQSGRSGPLPKANAGWALEEANDVDMVSAICPHCRILLVEAASADTTSLGIAEDTAIAKGARFVSNSWSGFEFTGQDTDDHYFNHPGDAIVFAAGDVGYGPAYPTDTQYVTSVGGTKLVHKRSGGRAWTETVWGGTAPGAEGTGSGCSAIEAKPSWQSVDDRSPAGCLNRTENDVSADGDPSTGVAVYDTYRTGGTLVTVGGTSVATPIITAVYALAGKPAKGTYPASYLYRHASDFNRVASGANGVCESDRQYLCHGEHGYNGPGGLGTPRGTGGFSSAGVAPVTVLDPGTQDIGAGQGVRLTVQSVDSDGSARSLSYRASGLPAGLSIGSAARSLNGTISGTVPATAGSYHVTVTAKDTRTGRTGTTHFSLYVIPSLAAPSLATSGEVVGGDSFDGSGCLSAPGTTSGTAVEMDFCDDASVSQEWEYLPGAALGAPATLSVTAGICLGLSGSDAVLQDCNGSAGQQWEYEPTGVTSPAGAPTSVLYNPGSGRCLDGQSAATMHERVIIAGCSVASSAYGQDWAIDASFAVLAGTGRCIESSSSGGITAPCSASDSSEAFQVTGGTISGPDGCLAETSLLSGHGTSWEPCSGNAINLGQGIWVPGPGGELINGYSGRCLDDVGSGDQLVQDDCYGLPGEEWALN